MRVKWRGTPFGLKIRVGLMLIIPAQLAACANCPPPVVFNQPPEILEESLDPPGPYVLTGNKPSGGQTQCPPIRFTAFARDGNDSTLFYKYFLRSSNGSVELVKDDSVPVGNSRSTTSAAIASVSFATPGNYFVELLVADGPFVDRQVVPRGTLALPDGGQAEDRNYVARYIWSIEVTTDVCL